MVAIGLEYCCGAYWVTVCLFLHNETISDGVNDGIVRLRVDYSIDRYEPKAI
jgi:hypothetical protein